MIQYISQSDKIILAFKLLLQILYWHSKRPDVCTNTREWKVRQSWSQSWNLYKTKVNSKESKSKSFLSLQNKRFLFFFHRTCKLYLNRMKLLESRFGTLNRVLRIHSNSTVTHEKTMKYHLFHLNTLITPSLTLRTILLRIMVIE